MSGLLLSGCGLFGGNTEASTSNGIPDNNSSTGISQTEPPKPTNVTAQSLSKRIPVIMYHDIVVRRGRGTVWFDCTEAELKEQFDKIVEQGYKPISLDLLYEHLTSGTTLPDKPIVLTFDDNYQGFYDLAYPMLKEYGFAGSVFVHTAFVGNKEGDHPKMDWETLKLLVKDPLITIAGHTITHPNLIGMSETAQTKELLESKQKLEQELGIKCDYFAYPEGKYDDTSLAVVKECGYKMAFTIKNGPAEMSPDIYTINRYIHTRFDKALEDCEQALRSAPNTVTQELVPSPVELEEIDEGRFKMVMLKGGMPGTITSGTRETVSEYIERSNGAKAGINGTFFPLAAVASTDNRLLGPSISPDRSGFFPDDDRSRWERIANRPLILWDDKQMMMVPFVPEWMNREERILEMMPNVTNLFLSGAWLVHDGVVIEEKDLRAFATKDVMDFRRRAAFGILMDGRPFGAAAKNSVSSLRFAEGLVKAGVKEAFLLDSGFSTSLVFNEKVLASGHSTKDKPSRPVPHAILFFGDLDPESVALADKLDVATTKSSSSSRRRR